jgi:tetraacyldisaccharide 4'-kinase
LRSRSVSAPVISVGNLSVGGTGKTPIAAFLVQLLLARKLQPAILMRGYGRDEIAVHEVLNPGVPGLSAADRVAAANRAVSEFGAGVLVLDDGFQHRRLRRDLDIVLISADGSHTRQRMLPAGPMREPMGSLCRASLVIVTRKCADDAAVDHLMQLVARRNEAPPVVVASLRPHQLVSSANVVAPLSALQERRVMVVTSIAVPAPFVQQMRDLGAQVTPTSFRDHHEFSASDVRYLLGQAGDAEMLVCTLKDAVKLRPLWPRNAIPLLYVSQAVVIEHGGDILNLMLDSRIAPKL